jgi:hypothetical protein
MVRSPVRREAYSSAIAPCRQTVGDTVQRLHIPDLVLHADLQVVLQVFSDSFEFMNDRNAMPFQEFGCAYPGKLQKLRRADRTGGKNRLPLCVGEEALSAVGEFDADCHALIQP